MEEYEILVTEDESANYLLVNAMLKKVVGFRITWAKNGREAVEIIKQNPTKYLAVLMDIKMPEMDGVTALKEIKIINKDLPVIALTAYAFQTEKTEILKNGFADYITKPVKPGQILESINKVTGKSFVKV